MKVRFYCDIPSHGVRMDELNPWPLVATNHPGSSVLSNWTRVAFDVEIPSHLVAPPQDLLLPDAVATVFGEGQS